MTSPTPVRVETAREVYLDYLVRFAGFAFWAVVVAVVVDAVAEYAPDVGLEDVTGTAAAASSSTSDPLGVLAGALVALVVIYRYEQQLAYALGVFARLVMFLADLVFLPVSLVWAPHVVVHERIHVVAARWFGVQCRVEYDPSRVGPFDLPIPGGGECVPEPFSKMLRIPQYQHRLISLAPIVMWVGIVGLVWLVGVREPVTLARASVPLLVYFGPSSGDWDNILAPRGEFKGLRYDVGAHLESEGVA